jgi:hypothetical protein
MSTVFPDVISSKLSTVSSIALAEPAKRPTKARIEVFMVKEEIEVLWVSKSNLVAKRTGADIAYILFVMHIL